VSSRSRPGAIPWPSAAFSPAALADRIDRFARAEGVVAVALDGPQGWRDPATKTSERGVGRRCELAARTQGKVGVRPRTYPSTQRTWIEQSIETFAHLLARPGVKLADHAPRAEPGGYLVAECFPTSAWRSSGLEPLPGKGKRPALEPYYAALVARYELPDAKVMSHDDLQAIVAALTAAGAAGAALCKPVCHGEPGREAIDPTDGTRIRVEGLIWDVRPARATKAVKVAPASAKTSARRPTPPAERAVTRPRPAASPETPTVYLTERALAYDASAEGGRQIVLRGFPTEGTAAAPVRVRFELDEEPFVLVIGDSHCAWRAHQRDEHARRSFDRLFSLLRSTPGHRRAVVPHLQP
jgi:hypothetical protein